MRTAPFTIRAIARIAAWLCVPGLAAISEAPARDLSAMSGEEITVLQHRLTDAGCYTGAIDGKTSEALTAAKKACPDQEPVLRIETGMHVAPIHGLGVDSECRIAATGSDDKTVRLWSMPDGHLIRTQRLPIGEGTNGSIEAVAVSPDGKWVAAGGWDPHFTVDGKHSVYFFDSATGAEVRRLGAFEGWITSLAISPDGQRFAVSLDHGYGIRVLDIGTGRELMADRDYGGRPASSVAFGSDGALYASGFGGNGSLRRYGPDLKRTVSIRTPSGQMPFSVAIDPTGRQLAVGYLDTPSVDIFNATTLRRTARADTTGANHSLQIVAWSRDGRRLVAGGQNRIDVGAGVQAMVRTFTPDGRRMGADVAAAGNTINALRACNGDVAFASSVPSFGLISPDGAATTLASGRDAELGKMENDAFAVSPAGKSVHFGLGAGVDMPVLFDVDTGTLADSRAVPPDFLEPVVSGFDVDSWYANALPFGRYESGHSLALRSDMQGFVLGTDHFLSAFDAGRRLRWRYDAIGVVWKVDLARSGQLIVAAYGDGTIRWHRWSDGQELLALFVDAKDRRWVAWTPTGYYMASPGGEDLIGWQLNRGWEQQADFFPASRFRDRFNRPDIVRLVLETLDEDTAVTKANEAAKRRENTMSLAAKLPPVLRIADMADGGRVATAEVTVGYSWRSPSGQPVERIDVLIDGRPVKEVGLPLHATADSTEHSGSLSVSVPHRDTEVALIAWSGDLSSEAARLKLTWTGAAPPDNHKRKLFALAIGVSDYVAPEMALVYAAKDARDFATAFEGQKGGYYSDVITHVVADREVTRSSIIAGLEWLENQSTGPDDVSVLFLAGHGLTDEKQIYWFLPSDATEDDARAKGVSQDELRRSLQSLKGKVLWFLDTCHAGSAARRPPPDVNSLVNNVTAAENGGIVAFASSTGRESSVESSTWGNGAFTKAIVEGIGQGKADFRGKGINTSELDTFVEDRVQELTEAKQHPVMSRPPEEPDFIIAQARKP